MSLKWIFKWQLIWQCALGEFTFSVSCLRDCVCPFGRYPDQSKLILVEHSRIEINLPEIENMFREGTRMRKDLKQGALFLVFGSGLAIRIKINTFCKNSYDF
jgi:hypothetical protein